MALSSSNVPGIIVLVHRKEDTYKYKTTVFGYLDKIETS